MAFLPIVTLSCREDFETSLMQSQDVIEIVTCTDLEICVTTGVIDIIPKMLNDLADFCHHVECNLLSTNAKSEQRVWEIVGYLD